MQQTRRLENAPEYLWMETSPEHRCCSLHGCRRRGLCNLLRHLRWRTAGEERIVLRNTCLLKHNSLFPRLDSQRSFSFGFVRSAWNRASTCNVVQVSSVVLYEY